MGLVSRGPPKGENYSRYHQTPEKLCSPADVDAQVSTDAAGLGVSGVGLTQHHPSQLHDVLTLPDLKHRIQRKHQDRDLHLDQTFMDPENTVKLLVSEISVCLRYHGKDGSGGHVFAESSVERLVLQVQVVFLHVVFRGLNTQIHSVRRTFI